MDLVLGAGKDGVLYVLPKDTAAFGQGADFSRLKKPPIFFTYFPGLRHRRVEGREPRPALRRQDAPPARISGVLEEPVARGPMLFVWGENESLRAWTLGDSGQVTFLAQSAEVASAGRAARGACPAGFPTISANGSDAEHRDRLGDRTRLGRMRIGSSSRASSAPTTRPPSTR